MRSYVEMCVFVQMIHIGPSYTHWFFPPLPCISLRKRNADITFGISFRGVYTMYIFLLNYLIQWTVLFIIAGSGIRNFFLICGNVLVPFDAYLFFDIIKLTLCEENCFVCNWVAMVCHDSKLNYCKWVKMYLVNPNVSL